MTHKEIFGWTNFYDLYEDAVKEFDDAIFCEIGCFKGKSAVFLGEKIKEYNKNIKVVAVDLWPSPEEITQYYKFGAGQSTEGDIINEENISLMQQFVDNLNKAELRDVIFPLRSLSVEAASIFPDNYFSFIFVDAGHSYDQVTEDLKAWYPKLKDGGIIAGHDYNGGVYKAVNDFFMPLTEVDRICEDSWIWRKK